MGRDGVSRENSGEAVIAWGMVAPSTREKRGAGVKWLRLAGIVLTSIGETRGMEVREEVRWTFYFREGWTVVPLLEVWMKSSKEPHSSPSEF